MTMASQLGSGSCQAVPLRIPLPANGLEKAVEDGLSEFKVVPGKLKVAKYITNIIIIITISFLKRAVTYITKETIPMLSWLF